LEAPPDWVSLRIFLAAIDRGSLSRAADACSIALSAAARRIQELEAEQDQALLLRGPRGVKPTTAGEVFARHARLLLEQAGRLREDMAAVAQGAMGGVRLLAAGSALGGHPLAEALARFAAAQPRIRVELREGLSLPILRALEEGQAELGIVTSSVPVPRGLLATAWAADRLLVLMPARHLLASRAGIGFAELLDHPLVAVQEASAMTLLLQAEAEKLGRRPDFRFMVESLDPARQLVAAGHGLTVIPDGMAQPYAAALGMLGVPLTEAWASRRLLLVSQPEAALSLPAQLLRAHLLATAPPARVTPG